MNINEMYIFSLFALALREKELVVSYADLPTRKVGLDKEQGEFSPCRFSLTSPGLEIFKDLYFDAPVTVSEKSKEEVELLRLFKQADAKGRNQLMSLAFSLDEKSDRLTG
jgi:hypothetical protein